MTNEAHDVTDPNPVSNLMGLYEQLTDLETKLRALKLSLPAEVHGRVTNAIRDLDKASQRIEDALSELFPAEHPEGL